MSALPPKADIGTEPKNVRGSTVRFSMFERPVAMVEKPSPINMQRRALCKYRFFYEQNWPSAPNNHPGRRDARRRFGCQRVYSVARHAGRT
jgi:hypothetical protein